MLKLEGIWRAVVMDNNDPENRERILVRVCGVHSFDDFNGTIDREFGIWCEKVSSDKYGGGGRPEVDGYVWIMFQHDSNGNYTPFEGVWLGSLVTSG